VGQAIVVAQVIHMVFKGVLNSNFQTFSFELKNNLRFFEINFDLGFRVL